MKSIIFIAVITLTGLFFTSKGQAQSKKIDTISIHVDGICGMCKERIENALSVKGVKKADWDVKTQKCEVVYRKDKLTEKEIHQLINAVGHDTGKSKATKEQYATVHHCCKYREMEAR